MCLTIFLKLTLKALNCKKGGFVTIRHNYIRDFEANLLAKIHTDVETEPSLQPIEGKNVNGITGDNARPDVRARCVWRDANTNTSQQNVKTEKVSLRHEKETKQGYNRRIMNIEHGAFTLISFFSKWSIK